MAFFFSGEHSMQNTKQFVFCIDDSAWLLGLAVSAPQSQSLLPLDKFQSS
jgi:hypothetical protein